MSSGPPFERYPGPPAAGADVYRVISPYRDTLACVSASGKLRVVLLLLREDHGWRTVLEEPPVPDADEPPRWELAYRDPIELVFTTRPVSGVQVTAYVTVSRIGCELRLEPGMSPECLDDLVVRTGFRVPHT